jgi:hypothetical protein
VPSVTTHVAPVAEPTVQLNDIEYVPQLKFCEESPSNPSCKVNVVLGVSPESEMYPVMG